MIEILLTILGVIAAVAVCLFIIFSLTMLDTDV